MVKKKIKNKEQFDALSLSPTSIVDSFLARTFSDTAAMAATLNAVVVIVGIQPAIALTLVELGLELKNMYTALNVERGMELLESIKSGVLTEDQLQGNLQIINKNNEGATFIIEFDVEDNRGV